MRYQQERSHPHLIKPFHLPPELGEPGGDAPGVGEASRARQAPLPLWRVVVPGDDVRGRAAPVAGGQDARGVLDDGVITLRVVVEADPGRMRNGSRTSTALART